MVTIYIKWLNSGPRNIIKWPVFREFLFFFFRCRILLICRLTYGLFNGAETTGLCLLRKPNEWRTCLRWTSDHPVPFHSAETSGRFFEFSPRSFAFLLDLGATDVLACKTELALNIFSGRNRSASLAKDSSNVDT